MSDTGNRHVPGTGAWAKSMLYFICAYVCIILLVFMYNTATFSVEIVSNYTSSVSIFTSFLRQDTISNTRETQHFIVDIHVEAIDHQDITITWDGGENHINHTAEEFKRTIAIGGGLTSAKVKNITKENINSKFVLFTVLLPSFCNTASTGYFYHFYFGYDYTDPFFKEIDNLKMFSDYFYKQMGETCGKRNIMTYIHFVRCHHAKKPAWAQNDAMLEGYLDGMEYFYRVNDDSKMESSGWVEAFITTLNKYDPPNVGVVGPKHMGGNVAILTYDFVHKTHIDIHGFYYPREFPDWFADDWITKVYRPGRSTKLSHIKLKHTMSLGQRYRQSRKGGLLSGTLKTGQEHILKYNALNTKKTPIQFSQFSPQLSEIAVNWPNLSVSLSSVFLD